MKTKRVVIFGGIVAASIAVVVVLALRRSDTPVSDAEFLAKVRTESVAAPASGEAGIYSPMDAEDKRTSAIEVESTTFEMGVIPGDRITEKSMRVRNAGNAPLRIGDVTTSCHCTEGRMNTSVIPPGGEGELLISVNPERIPGFYADKVLTIPTNDPRNVRLQIHVVTHVEPEFEWETDQIDFGVVPKGETPEQTFTLRQLQDEPLEIEKLGMTNDVDTFVASFERIDESQWRVPGKREYRVHMRITPQAAVGVHRDTLKIDLNIPRFHFPFACPVTAIIMSPYTLSTNRITVKDAIPGGTYADVVTLTSQTPLKVLSVDTSNPALSAVQRPTSDGMGAAIDLTVAKSADVLVQRDTLEITVLSGGNTYTDAIPVIAILKAGS